MIISDDLRIADSVFIFRSRPIILKAPPYATDKNNRHPFIINPPAHIIFKANVQSPQISWKILLFIFDYPIDSLILVNTMNSIGNYYANFGLCSCRYSRNISSINPFPCLPTNSGKGVL